MPKFSIPVGIPVQGMPICGIQTHHFLVRKRVSFVARKLATGFAVLNGP